jgi:isopentenyl diphosphate isomerase/L-lactate dehydrogenase-like FMN-dependent dehydrogenase
MFREKHRHFVHMLGAVTTKSQVKALLKKGVQVSDIASAVGTGRSYVYQINA